MNPCLPFLLPKTNEKISIPKWLTTHVFCADTQVLYYYYYYFFYYYYYYSFDQILRSSSEWSAGISTTENSIHNAYTDLIINAKHCIYIEVGWWVNEREKVLGGWVVWWMGWWVNHCHQNQHHHHLTVLSSFLITHCCYHLQQNQFFISIAGDRTVYNQICAALYEKIVSSHRWWWWGGWWWW